MFILLSISFASAAQNETQITDDEKILTVTEDTLQTEESDEIISKINDNENLTADVGTYTELEQAFQTNAEFTFQKDYAAHQDDGIINIKKSITIDGKGHTIDAKGYTGIFQSDSKESNGITVVIKNLIFKNGVLLHGGAIYVDGPEKVTYILQNCTFINNTAWYEGGAIYFWGDGNILDISDSTFIKNQNHKDNGGGAIYLNAESTGIRNSIFENNLARSSAGGAINIDSKNTQGVLISNCNFNNNQVTAEYSRYEHRKGGAINYEGKSTLRVINSNFTNNQATLKTYVKIWNEQRYGGAITCKNILELGGCNFINNSAVDRGGAVHADTLVWLNEYNPCTFINNSIKTWNHVAANKGGAIYASTFVNNAYGLIFINNTGYYGGAIFINNKNDVTFQSCYFEGNVALTESKTQGSGAAIYVDSSGSTVTMVDNIFINNKATSDSGVFNCGKYGTIANNWWGNNNPDFKTAKYIVEWHRVGSNNIISDDRYLRAHLNATESQTGNSKLTVYFTNNKGEEFTGKLTNWNVEFSSDKDGVFTNKEVTNNRATVSFTTNAIQETVSAKINNQILILNITQTEGDFAWLQKQIDAASGTFDLTRDVTYTIGLDTITDGIKIEKPITINGNGHKINAQGKSRIFDISDTSNVVFNNITFMNGFTDTYAGAIKMDGVNDVKILNSKFINNTAEESCGAVLYENGKDLTISNCEFTNNKNDKYFGGAIRLIKDENVLIEKSKFTNNTGSDGGAIAISGDKNITIDGCEFRLNTAFKADGGAIYNDAEDVSVKNSIFIDNKAKADSIEYSINDTALTLALVGGANYMNAIKSEENITFSNVTYWNGKITTDSNPVRSSNESGINISLTVKDSQNRVIKNVTLTTDANGQAVFYFNTLKDGKYTFNATHFEDSYYTQVSEDDEFTASNTHSYPSEVKINIENGTEFSYGNVTIPFEVTNKTSVEVVITNSDFTHVFYDNETNLSYVMVDLPASDEYYNIIVFNHGNGTYEPASAEKAFKILKTNSTVKINRIADVTYSDPVTVSFSGDASSYNVTMYDKLGNAVFSRIINGNSIKIPGEYDAGTYNVTVINLGNENRTESKNSTKFNIIPKENSIVISADDAEYGKGVIVYITATADGEYLAHINSTDVNIHVDNGYGSVALDLAAGTYVTNVSFYNLNYNNVIETYNFTVTKAQSNVEILMGNVTYGQNTTVVLSDDFPTEYNVIILDSGNNIVFAEVINETSFVMPDLEVGQYNLTVTNIGNENITGSDASVLFDVTKDNHVTIIVDDEEYGRELLIMVFADVDGYYNVDINGTQLTIEVIDGFGYDNTTELNAGEYYANVTYDNPDYINIIENTTFTVYQAESNIQIQDIENITYGEDIIIEYYDNYNATFNVVIFDENDEVVFEVKTNATTVTVSDLDVGNYTVMVTNEGNENILGTSEFKNFTVLKITPDVNVTVGNVTYPDEIVVDLISDVSGNYNISIAGNSQTITLEANVAKHIPFALAPGVYEFTVAYAESENYNAVEITVPVTVSKADPEFKVKTSVNDKKVNITVNVNPNATGNVEITISGNKFYAPISDGQAVFTNDYSKGIYVANVTYPGDDYFKSASKNVVFTIIEILPNLNNTEITLEVDKIDNDVLIVASVNKTATGLIQIDIDGDSVFLPVNNGEVVYNVLLPAGNYTVTAVYLGDDQFNPNATSTTIEVNDFVKHNTTISAVPEVDNETVTLTVGVNSTATGFVEISIDGKKYYVPVEDGKAVFVNDFVPGNYFADVTYLGDDNFNNATTSAQFTVIEENETKKDTPIDVIASVDNETVTLTVGVNSTATGFVEISIDGKKYYVPVEGGKAVFVNDFVPGNYFADVTYLGDDNFNNATSSAQFTVIEENETKKDTPIELITSVDNETVTLEVSVDPSASGFVEFNIDGNKVCVAVEDGKAVLTQKLTDGEHEVTVTYLGDNKFNTNSTSGKFNTSSYHDEKLATVFSDITVSDDKISAVLKDENGNPISGAEIKYVVGGVEKTTVTDSNGLFSIDIVYDQEIVFSYEGNDTLNAVNTTLTISSPADPSAKFTSKFNLTTGTIINAYTVDFHIGERGKTIAFKLTDADGNPIANATVEFAYKTVYFNRTTDENGIVSIGISTQFAGQYLCALTYLGDDKHNGTFVGVYINVQKKPITISAKAKTFKKSTKVKKYTVTLKTKKCSSKNGKIYLKSGKKVTLKVNGKTYSGKINKKGQVTFKITNLKKKGKFTAVIKFKGDKTYKSASKKVKMTVK